MLEERCDRLWLNSPEFSNGAGCGTDRGCIYNKCRFGNHGLPPSCGSASAILRLLAKNY